MNAFDALTPDLILSAVEAQGFQPTGALFPLNSYENRVYEIALEENNPIVAKFYRPGRWTAEAIAEEHRFVWAAHELEVPTVEPLRLMRPTIFGDSLGQQGGFYFAIYAKFRGRMIVEHSAEDLQWLGRTMARLHNVGAYFSCTQRMALNPQTYGHSSIPAILALNCIPEAQRATLDTLLPHAVQLTEPFFAHAWDCLPLHGDCHHGNVLWNAQGPYLLDFDDMVIAPPVQDVWMLLHGDADEQRAQRDAFLDGYTMFREFDERSFILAEPLRTLRMIHHIAWLAVRHEEPAFQRAFPYFTQPRYWEECAQHMREQISLLQELG